MARPCRAIEELEETMYELGYHSSALLANLYTIRPFTAPFSHYATPSRWNRSSSQLGEDERKNHHARFPEYSHSRHQRQR